MAKKKAQQEEPEVDNTAAYAEAKEAFAEAKAESGAKWKEVQAFQKKHKLKPGIKPAEIADKKVGKAYAELRKAHKALKDAKDEAEAAMKEIRPARTGNFQRKYTYPEGTTSEEKKKMRAQWRAEAKRAAKAEAGEDAPKKSKKAKSTEAPAKKARPSKKKAAPVEVDEDED